MDNYLRIARIYLHGAAALWLIVCLFMASATWSGGSEEIAGQELNLVFSGIATLMFFPGYILGARLKQNFVHPWAFLLPDFRKKHLLVGTLIGAILLGVPILLIMVGGPSNVSGKKAAAALCVIPFVWGLWSAYHWGVILIGTWAILLPWMGAVLFSPADFSGFLEGANPTISLVLVFSSLIAFLALARRLLLLNEDMTEYHIPDLVGSDLFSHRRSEQARFGQFSGVWGEAIKLRREAIKLRRRTGPTGRRERITQRIGFGKRTAQVVETAERITQRIDLAFTNVEHVDELDGYVERGLWRRLQLWRLGDQPPGLSRLFARIFDLLYHLMSVVLILYMSSKPFTSQGAVLVSTVWIPHSTFKVWAAWARRYPRLGYESLRPRTREQFFRELGLLFFWDIVERWLWDILCTGIAAAIWARELLHVKNLILFIVCTAAGQLCAYALGIWFLKRGIAAKGVCYLFIVVCLYWLVLRTDFQVTIASAAILAAVSVGIIPLAYRRWLRADLD